MFLGMFAKFVPSIFGLKETLNAYLSKSLCCLCWNDLKSKQLACVPASMCALPYTPVICKSMHGITCLASTPVADASRHDASLAMADGIVSWVKPKAQSKTMRPEAKC